MSPQQWSRQWGRARTATAVAGALAIPGAGAARRPDTRGRHQGRIVGALSFAILLLLGTTTATGDTASANAALSVTVRTVVADTVNVSAGSDLAAWNGQYQLLLREFGDEERSVWEIVDPSNPDRWQKTLYEFNSSLMQEAGVRGYSPQATWNMVQEYLVTNSDRTAVGQSELAAHIESLPFVGGAVADKYDVLNDNILDLLRTTYGSDINLEPLGWAYDLTHNISGSAYLTSELAYFFVETAIKQTPSTGNFDADKAALFDLISRYVYALIHDFGVFDGHSMFNQNDPIFGPGQDSDFNPNPPDTTNPDGTAGPQLPLPPGPWDDDPEMRAVAQALWNGIVSAMGDSIGLGSGDVRNTLIDDFTEHWQHRWDPVGSFTDWTKTIFDAGVSLKDKVLDTWSFSYDSVSEFIKTGAVMRAELGLGIGTSVSPAIGGWLVKSGVAGYLIGINVKLFGDNVHQIGDHIEEFKLSDIGTIIKYNWDNPTSVMVSYWDGAKSAGLSLIYATGTDNVIDKVDDAIDKVTGWFD